MYTGTYFGVEFINHVYEPTEEGTTNLNDNFKFKWIVGNNVICRKSHRKSKGGIIDKRAYSSEGFCGGQSGGGTVKVYLIGKIWYYESEIKEQKQ